MDLSNSQKEKEDRLEYELMERPISLGCVVGRSLIKKSVIQKLDVKRLTPELLLEGTKLHFVHRAFYPELQSALSQSKYIHPSIITTVHVKMIGTVSSKNNSPETLAPVTNYVGDRKIESQAHVMWNNIERIVEICIEVNGGVLAPSALMNCIGKTRQARKITGAVISVKYQSMTGGTRSELEESKNLVDEGIFITSWDRAEWTQFRPFWKTDGMTDVEIKRYIYTCTQTVYNRMMGDYNKDGDYEMAVPHLVTYVFNDSTIIYAFSCPCNLYKCRGIRENPGRCHKVCPFVGSELHPNGSISFI